MDISRTATPIPRLKCIVDTCKYWEGGNHCKAEGIEVQGSTAHEVEETACGTFAYKRD